MSVLTGAEVISGRLVADLVEEADAGRLDVVGLGFLGSSPAHASAIVRSILKLSILIKSLYLCFFDVMQEFWMCERTIIGWLAIGNSMLIYYSSSTDHNSTSKAR